jgi:hypothetical protein
MIEVHVTVSRRKHIVRFDDDGNATSVYIREPDRNRQLWFRNSRSQFGKQTRRIEFIIAAATVEWARR